LCFLFFGWGFVWCCFVVFGFCVVLGGFGGRVCFGFGVCWLVVVWLVGFGGVVVGFGFVLVFWWLVLCLFVLGVVWVCVCLRVFGVSLVCV
ncbi:hypothetical protein, partial [Pseudomonas syringae group genomosp. 7]|uniref:hypothetical protein n=1 Tax=Pseudomonas syringae group genomosp. 7 TaxID=251699 RepID=UPI00377056AC